MKSHRIGLRRTAGPTIERDRSPNCRPWYGLYSAINAVEWLLGGEGEPIQDSALVCAGRLLGKVWVQPRDCNACGLTLDANHGQLIAGMAWWYRYYAKEQPAEDRGRYESAEVEAKAGGRGLWAGPNPINPYEWRKGAR